MSRNCFPVSFWNEKRKSRSFPKVQTNLVPFHTCFPKMNEICYAANDFHLSEKSSFPQNKFIGTRSDHWLCLCWELQKRRSKKTKINKKEEETNPWCCRRKISYWPCSFHSVCDIQQRNLWTHICTTWENKYLSIYLTPGPFTMFSCSLNDFQHESYLLVRVCPCRGHHGDMVAGTFIQLGADDNRG